MLLTDTLDIRIVPLNIKRLSLIYGDIKINDIIKIDVNHLSKQSPIIIECECEICGVYRKLQYRKYLKNYNRYGYYSCKGCKNLKTNITKEDRYGDKFYNNSQKMIETKEKLGIYVPLGSVNDFKKYRKIVNRFTYKSKKVLLKNWEGFDYYDQEFIKGNLQLESKCEEYPTIDHKISIHEGFIKNIPPYIIGNIDNICVTKRCINLKKRNIINYQHY